MLRTDATSTAWSGWNRAKLGKLATARDERETTRDACRPSDHDTLGRRIGSKTHREVHARSTRVVGCDDMISPSHDIECRVVKAGFRRARTARVGTTEFKCAKRSVSRDYEVAHDPTDASVVSECHERSADACPDGYVAVAWPGTMTRLVQWTWQRCSSRANA